MNVSGKVWGRTVGPIFSTPNFELHRLEINAKGECSEHHHAHKVNGFFVETGWIVVTTWKSTGLVDRTHLRRGESMIVPAGEKHKFEAVDDSIVYEAYWPPELFGGDIVRHTFGKRPGGDASGAC